MDVKNPLLVPELRELIQANDTQTLKEFCEAAHPAAIAELISALEPNEAWTILLQTTSDLRAEIFSHLDRTIQIAIIETLNRVDIAHLLADMPPDDRADLFKNLSESSQEAVLPGMAQAEREDIRRLTAYQEGTAGAAMTSDYAILPRNLTASQAIEKLRTVAPDKETIYCAYVVDETRKLVGLVSLRDLIVSRRDALIEDIMEREVVFAFVDDDQEDAARKIRKYDLIALPVTDKERALVGIITYDDAIDIIVQEQTEDIEKLMAIAGSHEDGAYMKTPVWKHFLKRSPWLVALGVLGLVTGFIVQSFEGILAQFAILAAFMPMLADTGGNTGSQSAALVIRALSLKEIKPSDILRVLGKELRVAVMLGLLLGSLAFGRVLIFGAGAATPQTCSLSLIGFAIALALSLQVIMSTMIGVILPLTAAKFKLDPAVVASPAMTTIVDITGLLIYFNIAKSLFNI